VVVVFAGWLLSVAAGQPPAQVLHVPGVAPSAEHI
jgi:hypothetical protein